jgi:hypothetical protein
MFALLEKNGARMAVHSKSDLDYMMNRGWRKVVDVVPVETHAEESEPRQKRKYTRKAKQ